jgi:hypothetical protein
MAKRIYSPATIAKWHSELIASFDAHGPATVRELMQRLKWSEDKTRTAIKTHPFWLVVVEVRNNKQNNPCPVYWNQGEHVLGVCQCGKRNFHPAYQHKPCIACDRREIVKPGVDPKMLEMASRPTSAGTGSDEKMEILSARIQLGLPLWNPADNRDYCGRLLRDNEEDTTSGEFDDSF